MWEHFKECFADGLLILAGVITFVVFILILIYGEARIIENNKWILWVELIIVSPGLIALGIERLIKDIKRNGTQKSNR